MPCNVISVDAKDSFRIYYESSWKDSQVQFRLLDSDGGMVWDVRAFAPCPDTATGCRLHCQAGGILVHVSAGMVTCAISVFADFNVAFVQWQDVDLMSTTSCLGPWTTCSIPVPKEAGEAADDFQLDFVVKGPKGDIDKPQEADTYHLDSPGGYKLSKGDIRPFPQASLAPFMLVCPYVLASCPCL